MTRLFLTALLPIAAALFYQSTEAREWTQASTGKSVDAEFVKAVNGVVTLRLPNGQEARVPINALIERDQNLIARLVEESESPGEDSWPHWRGPNRNGISNSKGIKKNWERDGLPARLWVYDDAGLGYSSFCIARGVLYSLGTRGSEMMAFALRVEDGRELWATKIADDLPDEEKYNLSWGRGPRSSPAFSAGMIYMMTPLGKLVAVDTETGELKWEVDLVEEFDGRSPGWGYAETPLIDGDKVLVTPGHALDGGAIVALNKQSGEVIWHARGLTDGRIDKVHYTSITPATINDTRQYIQLFQNTLVGVDAETGERLWSADWPRGRTAVIPTPLVEGNRIYVTSGYGAGAMLVEVMPNWNVRQVWANTVMKNHKGGVVKVGDHVYGFSDAAGLIAQSFDQGKLVWHHKSQFFEKGSIVAADNRLIVVNEKDGRVSLVEPDPTRFVSRGSFLLQPQSQNRDPKAAIWARPAVAGGKLFLRDQELIICYDLQ